MKKTLAILLTVAMLAGMMCIMPIASSAAEGEYVGMIDSGYATLEHTSTPGESYVISFDLWLFNAGNGICFWSDTATHRFYAGDKTGMFNGSDNSLSSYTTLSWGAYDWSNSHHFEIRINDTASTSTIYVDGTLQYTYNGTVDAWGNSGFELANTDGSVALDNLTITSLDGTATYLSEDFQGTPFTDNFTKTANPYVAPNHVTKGDSGYCNPVGNEGQGDTWTVDFDLYLFNAGDGIQIWAGDSASTRVTVTDTQAGIEHAGGACPVASNYTAITWGALNWTTHHAVSMSISPSLITISIDGTQIYSQAASFSIYTDYLLLNTKGTGCAIDNFVMKNAGGTVVASNDFESGIGDWFGAQTLVPTATANNMAKFEGYICASLDDDNNADTDTMSYTLDLALRPGAKGLQSSYLELWDSGVQRFKIGATEVGYNGNYVAYDWGTCDLNNIKNVVLVMNPTDGTASISINGTEVYTTTAFAGRKVWTGVMIGYIQDGCGDLDNVVVRNVTQDKEVLNFNAEGTWWDGDAKGTKDMLYPCSLTGAHFASLYTEVVSPATCFAKGVTQVRCDLCGEVVSTGSIPQLQHEFADYNDGSRITVTAPTETTDGLYSWACKNGCGTCATTTIPATNKYTGTIYTYTDCSDANVVKEILNISEGNDAWQYDNEVVADGVITLTGEGANYHVMDAEEKVDTQAGYTVSVDMYVTGTQILADESYGQTIYWWVGGATGLSNMIGYDFANKCFFIRNSTENLDYRVAADFPLNQWHTLTMKFQASDALWDASYAALYLDGKEVLKYTGEDAAFALPNNTKDSTIHYRIFNIQYKMDNLTVGDINFNWVYPAMVGDVNGDSKINARDLLVLRKYIAGMTVNGFVASNADFDYQRNGIGLSDALSLRKFLAGAPAVVNG